MQVERKPTPWVLAISSLQTFFARHSIYAANNVWDYPACPSCKLVNLGYFRV